MEVRRTQDPDSGAGAAVRNEGGFALLMVLLTLIGLTALAAAGFVLSNSDNRVSQNHASSLEAFLTANAGLYEYLGTRPNGETAQTYTYGTGTADVSAQKLLEIGDGRRLYRITALATYDSPEGGIATRTISAVAMYSTGEVEFPAAIAAVPGLLKEGGSGNIDGNDHADEADCEIAVDDPVAGVLVPPGGYTQNGGSSVPEGDPAVLEMDQAALMALLNLDWQDVVNGGLYPDYTLPPDDWPDFGALPPDDWPIVQVTGDMTVSSTHSGQGTLVVNGDLTMNGSFQWDGIMLVGGVLTSNGDQTIEGAVVTGLNVLLGQTVGESHLANGNKKFRYNSCNVVLAKEKAFGGLVEIPGTWAESL